MTVEYIGPFEHHEVVVNGWAVPLLSGRYIEAEESVVLSLDGRMAVSLPVAAAPRVVEFIANCIAVAQGFTCHPSSAESELIPRHHAAQPYRLIGLSGEDEVRT